MANSEDSLHLALAAERRGQPDEARMIAMALLDRSLDPPILNSAGSILMRIGETALAVRAFAAARVKKPLEFEYALNHAIGLTADGRAVEALDILRNLEKQGARQARYWSVRANAARQANLLEDARRCYEHAIACDAGYQKAHQGLAQVALERGQSDAVALFDTVIQADRANPYLWHGLVEALADAGDRTGALALARQIVQQAPQWLPGLKLLAQMRLAAGDSDYTDHYAQAMRHYPNEPAIPAAWVSVMAGLDDHRRAAKVAGEAATRFPHMPQFRLLEAIHASNAGDLMRAGTIFAALTLASAERFFHEARHAVRIGRFDDAERLLDLVLREEPWNVSAWALRDLIWRAVSDPRHQWLHGQAGLVRSLPLSGGEELLTKASALLRELHARSALPVDQSLRGGTQTRGSLFARHEPVLADMKQAIEQVVESYRQGLPSFDTEHPLLRHCQGTWSLAGSWSVRLTGGGDHHTAHCHSQGIVSSALYLVVPEAGADEALLELGRPPPDLRLDLPPMSVVEPKPGMLALFPSTLYHGTTPFRGAERITVAFDVVAREPQAR